VESEHAASPITNIKLLSVEMVPIPVPVFENALGNAVDVLFFPEHGGRNHILTWEWSVLEKRDEEEWGISV
jgi:hypothetical protein